MVERKSTENGELYKELQKHMKKNGELSKQVAELQQSIQAEKAAANSAKWREQNLQQELKLSRQSNEWFENEVKTKREEALKYRKEKGARIAELERLNEEARSKVESLTRGDQQLRSRLDGAQMKADESLSKVQQLQEAAARTEESFRQEIESSKRLVELKEQQTETHLKRLQDVEKRLEHLKDEDEQIMSRLRKDIEHEKAEHEKTDRRVSELEEEISRLEALLSSPAQAPSAPQTPRANGSLLRAGSPFGTPGTLRGKTSISATQAIEELFRVKAELISEKKRSQQLSQDLDEVMGVLETKGPELSELQEEAERLRNENVQMSQLTDESYQERDATKRAARKAEAALSTAQAEGNILRAQLRDLGIQIQLLVFNMSARERGIDELSQEEALRFEQLQRGETTEGALDDMSDTHRFITERFVAFKDISELQSKNQELLRITRELADKMESEEALAAKQQVVDNENELVGLRESVSRLQDEVKSMTIRMKSHMQERDMFRRLLQNKANAPEINSALGGSVDGSHREVLASIEQNSTIDEAELTTALRELQGNFDSYRNEQAVDRKTMREQLDKLSAEKNSLQGEITKVRSQLDLASERFGMLQSNYEALQNEKTEIQKRNQTLSESAAKQDMRSQQLAADLIETKAMLDSLNSKRANLEAEKELNTTIRDRLSQDNESLSQEKARLSTLLTQQQTLLNERELSESEAKRRLSEQTEVLKAELETTKRKLSEEIEGGKKIQLRKEFEAEQHQKRVDDLVATLNAVKEELVAAKTSKDHLQARVEELTIELRNAREKAERLQPRPTPRPGTTDEQQTADEETEAQIQALIDEVSDLKRDLDLANSLLTNAKTQAEQYREISQAAEEELNAHNTTQEQYREEVESALASKDAQIKELQQRVEDLSTELANSNNELSSIRDSQAEFTRKFDEEKRILESEVARLKDDGERLKERAKYHQQDLRAQADIAKKAQQDYEHELVKHAEAAQALQAIRSQHNKVKTESASLRSEAESAKHALEENKQSFAGREKQLRQEIADLKERRKDTDQQNKMLQDQLNSVTSQIASIKENRAAFMQTTDAATVSTPGSDLERFMELNMYLSREKDIIEVQYNLKVHEAERLQQQLEIKQSQLDDTQLKLEQERSARADNRASITHQDLMTKLEELNLIRESNITLRNENKRIEKQLAQSKDKIKELDSVIEPLRTRVSELESSKEFLEEEIKQLGEDRDRWQKRTEGILTKYGRVDPAEMEQLKQTVTDLEAERDALKQAAEPLNARITELETTYETEKSSWTETRGRIVRQAKDRNDSQKAKIAALQEEKDGIQQQLDEASQKLAALQTDLEGAHESKRVLEEQANDLQQQLQSANQNAAEPNTEAEAVAPSASAEQVTQLEQQLESIQQELTAANDSKAEADQELENLRAQLAAAVDERDAALAQVQQPASQGEGEVLQTGVDTSQSQPPVAGAGMSDAERAGLEKKVADLEKELAEVQAKLAEADAKVADAEARIEEQKGIVEKRSQKMKEQLNKRLSDKNAELEKTLTESKEKLQAEFELKLQQERAIWAAENATPTAATPAPVASTPVKQTSQQPPSTPNPAVSSMLAADFLKLSDPDTRLILDKNQTLKTIVSNNLKTRLGDQSKKIREEVEKSAKTEWEAKVASAKEQATMMESKKSSLRINMAENKLKNAMAKLGVVEVAAKETPERPVGEVWTVAKDARAPPAAAALSVVPSSPAPTGKSTPAVPGTSRSLLQNSTLSSKTDIHQSAATTSPLAPTASETKLQPVVNGGPAQPARAVPPATNTASPTTKAPNPFASATVLSGQNGPPAAANPFAPSQTPAQSQPASQIPPPQAGTVPPSQAQPVRTGIPVPSRGGGGPNNRGGARGGGVYQHPRGGRGGYAGGPNQNRNVSNASMNPSAETFSPGNKRPHPETGGPAGGPPKKQRGGGGPNHRGT